MLPNTIRAIFTDPSNCEKTNALFALLLHSNGLHVENIYIYSKSLNQPKYTFISNLLNNVEGLWYFSYNDHKTVISPNDAKLNSVMIFYDLPCDKQGHICYFCCIGRHNSIDNSICVKLISEYQNIL